MTLRPALHAVVFCCALSLISVPLASALSLSDALSTGADLAKKALAKKQTDDDQKKRDAEQRRQAQESAVASAQQRHKQNPQEGCSGSFQINGTTYAASMIPGASDCSAIIEATSDTGAYGRPFVVIAIYRSSKAGGSLDDRFSLESAEGTSRIQPGVYTVPRQFGIQWSTPNRYCEFTAGTVTIKAFPAGAGSATGEFSAVLAKDQNKLCPAKVSGTFSAPRVVDNSR